MKKETSFIFVTTLPEPYYAKMIGNAMRNFVKMVWSGELIEHGIKNKKIEGKPISAPLGNKATLIMKKEGDAHAVFVNQQSKGKASYASQPSYSVNPLPLFNL